MNAIATLALDAPDRRVRRGLSVGWSASLLVHAAIVAWLLQAPAPHPPEATPGKRIEVRLAPPSAPASAATAVPDAASAAASPRARPAPAHSAPAARAHAHASASAPAYATRPAPAHTTPDTNAQAATPAAADTAAASNAPAESSPAPTVDMAAARAAARLIAREQGKSLVALPARKPVVDPNGDRQVIDPIEAARKPDCKSAYAGAGLLAVIPLAASAIMDTGCKW